LGPRPHLHGQDRGARLRAQERLHDRDRDPQHAAGLPRQRPHGFLLPWPPDRVRQHGADLHLTGPQANRRLHHGKVRMTMERHFEKSLSRLGNQLREMTVLCDESLDAAARAFKEGDAHAAESAFMNERRINQLEVGIDNEVVETLAQSQPVAVDLGYLLAILKINNDLERIGDHAVNIAQSAVTCAGLSLPTRLELPRMFALAQNMLRDACRSFFEKDMQTARMVLETDDMVDGL